MAYKRDHVILRSGEAGAGKVENPEFTISTSFGKVTLKKSKIVHIHFMRPDGTGFPPSDQIMTINGDDLHGKIVTPKVIDFVLASSGQKFKIHRDKIHTLVFLGSIDPSSSGYPDFS